MQRVAGFFRTTSWARLAIFMLADAAVVTSGTALAYTVRFEGRIGSVFLSSMPVVLLASVAVYLTVFIAFGIYRHVWRYVGVDMFLKLALAVISSAAILALVDTALVRPTGLRFAPYGVLVIAAAFTYIGTGGVRALARLSIYAQSRSTRREGRRALIIGAGDAGSLLLRDLELNGDRVQVVGFLDDDEHKTGRLVRGVCVLGSTADIPRVVERESVTEVYIALPSATAEELRRILDLCVAANVSTRIVPSAARITGSVHVNELQPVDVLSLLGRASTDIDLVRVAESLIGRRVMVTGAAGSIGSELCRQISKFGPKCLLMLDIDESRLYELHLEMARAGFEHSELHLCDVRDIDRLRRVFAETSPDVVFHAAAYKHVPLMEAAPEEAVLANVLGTRNVLEACRLGAASFLMISTDKAVEPTSMMGATKAIAELLTMDASRSGQRAVSVRFGNVLGSRGSVVPIFEAQLRAGEPLLVTHPEATRFFMTISEASRLVLQAHSLDQPGTLYVLDMGEPVRIMDLARKMIALSGAKAEIEFVGLRPAEKVHETLVRDHEQLMPTGAAHVLYVNVCCIPSPKLHAMIDGLIVRARAGDRDGVRSGISEILADWLSACR